MNVLDLFCGAGGLSEGFKQENFNILAGVDNDERFLKTFNTNNDNKGLQVDLMNKKPKDFFKDYNIDSDNIDILVGGPPCQGFSMAGRRNPDDERNNLVDKFIDYVEYIKPKIVVMENVPGILSMKDGEVVKVVEKRYENIGYNLKYKKLNSENYGIPQARKRVIFIGSNEYDNVEKFYPDKKDNIVTVWEAISDLPKEVFFDKKKVHNEVKLKEINSEYQEKMRFGEKVDLHIAKKVKEEDLEIVNQLKEGKVYNSNRGFTKRSTQYMHVWEIYSDKLDDLEKNILKFIGSKGRKKEYKVKGFYNTVKEFKILEEIDEEKNRIMKKINSLIDRNFLEKRKNENGLGYSFTYKAGVRDRYYRVNSKDTSRTLTTGFTSPKSLLHPKENRGLSLREGARIQSFKDNFKFEGTWQSIKTQIGNAVPPLLSQEIAKKIK